MILLALNTPVILMVFGGLVWLAGELLAVFTGRAETDTTSAWVWKLEKALPIARVLIAVFLVWLGLHFWFQIP